MKKMGFTLVELLAVIVIIGLLAVLIIPKIKDTVSDSKNNANELSAKALVRTATNYYLEKKANKSFNSCVYDFSDDVNDCNGFEFTGDRPDSGRIQIKNDGTIALAVQFDKYCYIKSFDSDNLEVISYDDSICGKNASVFDINELP